MADVFISYKSERRAAAEHLAEILSDYGYSVWWDYGLVSGRDFGAQIERELRAAKAVVVLWCALSRDSEWVLEEATLAKKLGTAIPTMIERIDLPLGFARAQTLDLSDWDGAPRSHKLERLLRDIGDRVGRPPQPNLDGLDRTDRAWRRFGAPSLKQFALVTPLEREAPARTMPGVLAAPAPRPSPPRMRTVIAPHVQAVRRRVLPQLALVGIVGLAVAAGAGGYFLYDRAQAAQAAATTWEHIDKSDPAAIRAFLASANVGEWRGSAQAALEGLELKRLSEARAADTIESLEKFIHDFPDSSHALEINGRIAELRAMPPADLRPG